MLFLLSKKLTTKIKSLVTHAKFNKNRENGRLLILNESLIGPNLPFSGYFRVAAGLKKPGEDRAIRGVPLEVRRVGQEIGEYF